MAILPSLERILEVIFCAIKDLHADKGFEHADEEQLTRLNAWVDAVAFNPEEKVAAVTELYNRIGVKELCEKRWKSIVNAQWKVCWR